MPAGCSARSRTNRPMHRQFHRAPSRCAMMEGLTGEFPRFRLGPNSRLAVRSFNQVFGTGRKAVPTGRSPEPIRWLFAHQRQFRPFENKQVVTTTSGSPKGWLLPLTQKTFVAGAKRLRSEL